MCMILLREFIQKFNYIFCILKGSASIFTFASTSVLFFSPFFFTIFSHNKKHNQLKASSLAF